MIGRLLSHYEISALLGKGGMGDVYRARDTKLGREVALKILPGDVAADPIRLKRFQREARAVASLNHPNIVTLYSVENAQDTHFLTMELVEGRDLQQTLAAGKPTPTETLSIGIALAQALQAAHAKGIVHRDLKPANIVLDAGGRVKVLDFGMAKLAEAEGDRTDQATQDLALTTGGALLGTVPYMSPEQARGEAADHRADLWALGVVLYEMTAGRRPFLGEDIPAVLYQITRAEPPALSTAAPESPPKLVAVVTRLLAKNRKDRYQSAGDVIADLENLASVHHATTTTATPEIRPPLLAVLPFSGLKPDPETDFLGFALADQVIGSLAYIKNILIKPSSAVRKYQGQAIDQATAAKDLGVDYLLTGYYLKEADTVRLNVELVKAGSEDLVWREAIQVRYDNVFELQDIVSEKVVQGLEIQFPGQAKDRPAAYVPTDPAAYEYYLRSLSAPHTNEGDKLAIGLLRHSINLDDDFAAAHAELGARLANYGLLALQGPETYHQVEACYRDALDKDGENLQALGGLAGLSADTGKLHAALELNKRMLQINPNHARSHAVRANILRISGMLDESREAVRTALALDPDNPDFHTLGFTGFYARQYDEAIDVFNLDKTSFRTLAWVGFSKYLKGEQEEGLKLMKKAADSEPDAHLGHHFGALMAGWRGDMEEGLALARAWEAPGHYDCEWYYNLANTYAVLGDLESCERTLRRSVEGGFSCYDYLANDPLLAPMRKEPVIAALIEQARRNHLAFKKVFEEATT